LTIPLVLILFCSFSGCASSDLRVSEFKFKYNEKDYIIRSAYCPDDPSSCNQLIGNDFIAVDMNQDRIIDKINKGDISLAEAQSIYDYSLSLLKSQNKLNEVGREEKNFKLRELNFDYEIKTFTPQLGEAFNEFKLVDRRGAVYNFKISIYIDENADGNLDKTLKGDFSLSDAQNKYKMMITKGLAEKQIVKENGSFLVR
jgi:hypothetical protein